MAITVRPSSAATTPCRCPPTQGDEAVRASLDAIGYRCPIGPGSAEDSAPVALPRASGTARTWVFPFLTRRGTPPSPSTSGPARHSTARSRVRPAAGPARIAATMVARDLDFLEWRRLDALSVRRRRPIRRDSLGISWIPSTKSSVFKALSRERFGFSAVPVFLRKTPVIGPPTAAPLPVSFLPSRSMRRIPERRNRSTDFRQREGFVRVAGKMVNAGPGTPTKQAAADRALAEMESGAINRPPFFGAEAAKRVS